MVRIVRWAGVAVLGVLTWRFARAPLDGSALDSFLHLPNLVFHEAGHVLFSPFGQFMTALGGSVLQVLIPVACAVSFVYQYENRFGAAVCAWWAGQNLVDIAPYVADARRLQLVLIGGRTGAEVEGHDWEYALGSLGWLHLDQSLGRGTQLLGVFVMVAALVWAVMVIRRGPDELT